MATRLSFKAFWDAVEQRLTACSAEELRAIVRHQRRGSYDKAALLLAACTALLRRLGKAREGAALLDDVRQRFPRHRAFQTELQAAVRRMGG